MMRDNGIEKDVHQEESSSIYSDLDNNEDLSIHHKVPLALEDLDWDNYSDVILKMDSGPMSQQMRAVARRDKQILLSIRHKLKRNNIILRASYKGNGFHMSEAKEFQQKASNYMTQLRVYSLIRQLNGSNPEMITQQCLVNIVNRVETTLSYLFRSKCLTKFQYIVMKPNRRQVQLNYMYYVPEMNQEVQEILLRPITVCNNGPTVLISHRLSELLWSMFDRVTHCQKFSDGADAAQALELYAQRNLLRSTTLLVTFTMDDICTVFPHRGTLEALNHFLKTYASSDEAFQKQGMTIHTIMKLVRLVLENQYFVYDNRLYRQTDGGASGSPLSMPLAYIYLFRRKPILVNTFMKNTHEIFGRHLDEAFLTWNGSKQHLSELFDMTNNKQHYASLRLKPSIGFNVHFIDAYLSHNNGILHTKVYHHPHAIQKTLFDMPSIPICSDPKYIRKNLIHTVRCCSKMNDFNDELNCMKLSFASHGLSTTFMEQYIQQFFIEFGLLSISLSIYDPDSYRNLRERVTSHEQQKAKWKKEQKINDENTLVFHCSTDLDAIDMIALKQELNNAFKDYSNAQEFKLKFVPLQPTSLSPNDYLVNKRPPLRLLTLSTNDKANNSDDDEDDNSDHILHY